MAASPDVFHARALAAAAADGRLRLSSMLSWEIFPFEPAELTLVPLAAPVLPEPAREGVGGVGCRSCESEDGTVWSDDHWRLAVGRFASGVPLRLMLFSREHVDYPDLG